jgi:SDR family mycofactocin-dependent oxidoreductase
MGKLDGKVAFITGAARGQGRSHAIRLAEEGADIIAMDICSQLDSVPYPMATPNDLMTTVKEVESLGRRIIAAEGDVRDFARLEAIVADGIAELGRIDIVVANAGIGSFGRVWELSPETWREMVDINLNGVFNTVRAALPIMIEASRGGSIVLTSSVAGLAAFPNCSHYTAAKHGVVGLMRSLAVELAQYNIRANSVHPTTVDTDMVQNSAFYEQIGAETREQAAATFSNMHALNIPWVEMSDISNAVLWLACDESRYVTGLTMPIDGGCLQPFRVPHAQA